MQVRCTSHFLAAFSAGPFTALNAICQQSCDRIWYENTDQSSSPLSFQDRTFSADSRPSYSGSWFAESNHKRIKIAENDVTDQETVVNGLDNFFRGALRRLDNAKVSSYHFPELRLTPPSMDDSVVPKPRKRAAKVSVRRELDSGAEKRKNKAVKKNGPKRGEGESSNLAVFTEKLNELFSTPSDVAASRCINQCKSSATLLLESNSICGEVGYADEHYRCRLPDKDSALLRVALLQSCLL